MKLNIRTFHRCLIPVPLLFIAVGATMILPENHWFVPIAGIAQTIFIIVAAICAVMGILLMLGKFHFGCPECNSKTKLARSGEEGTITLNCEQCGQVETTTSWWVFFKYKVTKKTED